MKYLKIKSNPSKKNQKKYLKKKLKKMKQD